MGTMYRNGFYYGGGSGEGGIAASLNQYEIGYGNKENNIVGSSLFTKKYSGILNELCGDRESGTISFSLESLKHPEKEQLEGEVIITNNTTGDKILEEENIDKEILQTVNKNDTYTVEYHYGTFNNEEIDDEYYIKFKNFDKFTNIKMNKVIEEKVVNKEKYYMINYSGIISNEFDGKIIFSESDNTDLAIYTGKAKYGGGKFFLKEKGVLNIGGNNLTSLDGDTRFTMHDAAEMDLTGGIGRPNAGPKIWMHGNATIMSHDGWYPIDTVHRPYYIITATYKYSYQLRDPENITPSISAFDTKSIFKAEYYYYDYNKKDYVLAGYINSYASDDAKEAKGTMVKNILSSMSGFTLKEKTLDEEFTGKVNNTSYYYYQYTYKYEASGSGLYPSMYLHSLGERGGKTEAQVLHPTVSLMDGSKVYAGGKANVLFQDNAHFSMKGTADCSLEDGYIFHGKNSNINIDGSTINFNKSTNTSLSGVSITGKNNNVLIFQGADVQIVDGGGCPPSIDSTQRTPTVRVLEGGRIDIGAFAKVVSYNTRTNAHQKYMNRNSTLYGSVLRIQGYAKATLDSYAFLKMHMSSAIEMDGISTINLQDESYHYMGGSSSIVFNDSKRQGINSPCIMANPTDMTFAAMGNGELGQTSVHKQRYCSWNKQKEGAFASTQDFDGKVAYQEYDKYSIYFDRQISGNELKRMEKDFSTYSKKSSFSELFDVQTDGNGDVISKSVKTDVKNKIKTDLTDYLTSVGNYTFRVGGNTRCMLVSKGTSYINIGAEENDDLNINIHNSSFINTTGHSHIEAHDDSTFIMRGQVGKKDDGSVMPPWSDGDDGWKRPILTRENGPGVGYYDNSTFLMRGKWNIAEEITSVNKTFIEYDLTEFPETPNDFNEKVMNTFKETLKKDGLFYLQGGTVSYAEKENGEYSITVSDIIVTDKPTDWKEHPEKKEGSPLVEIIEDSELKLYGESKILMDDEGVTFANATGSVTFTIQELQALKNLLGNA